MSFARWFQRLNAWDPAGFRPFRVAGADYGRVRPALAAELAALQSDAFRWDGSALHLLPDSFASRSQALAAAASALHAADLAPPPTGELYPGIRAWGEAPAFAIPRAVVPAFGVAAFGVHLNGWVRRGDGPYLWVARRAEDRRVAPGKLDNLVAGGQPLGLTLRENLQKEALEEAGIPADLVARATSRGAISYIRETPEGLKPDTLFVFDLELPEAFVPENRDGEVAGFRLLPAAEAAGLVRHTEAFKENCNLVVIDWLDRHALLPEAHGREVAAWRQVQGRVPIPDPETAPELRHLSP